MNRNTTHSMLITCIGVLMFLLKPFIFYQFVANYKAGPAPFRATALLQRAVKKKDDHYESENTIGEEASFLTISFQTPLKRIFTNILNVFALLMPLRSLLSILAIPVNTVAQLVPDNHCYRQQSRFQI